MGNMSFSSEVPPDNKQVDGTGQLSGYEEVGTSKEPKEGSHITSLQHQTTAGSGTSAAKKSKGIVKRFLESQEKSSSQEVVSGSSKGGGVHHVFSQVKPLGNAETQKASEDSAVKTTMVTDHHHLYGAKTADKASNEAAGDKELEHSRTSDQGDSTPSLVVRATATKAVKHAAVMSEDVQIRPSPKPKEVSEFTRKSTKAIVGIQQAVGKRECTDGQYRISANLTNLATGLQAMEEVMPGMEEKMGKEFPIKYKNDMEKLKSKFDQIASDFNELINGKNTMFGLKEKNINRNINDALSSLEKLKQRVNDDYAEELSGGALGKFVKGNTCEDKSFPYDYFQEVQVDTKDGKESGGDWKKVKEDWSGKDLGYKVNDHHKQFKKDISRCDVMVDGKKFKPKVGATESDINKVCHSAGTAISESLLRSKAVRENLDVESQQLLRYQLESFSCQTASNLKLEYLKNFVVNYMDNGFATPAYKSTIECNFTEPDKITIVKTDYSQVKSFNDDKTVLGYDATRTTVTIDLAKITKEELLATPGAVTVDAEAHGFRKKLEDVNFQAP